MKKKEYKKFYGEIIVSRGFIVLTFISLMITVLNLTYLIYQNSYNVEHINNFLQNYVNGSILWIDNILLYIFSIMYIIIGIKSKKDVVAKVSFGIFSSLTTMVALTLVINMIAKVFGIF